MVWTTPSLKEIRQTNRDYISGKTGGAPLIANSALRALADANAGNVHLIMQYIDHLSQQLLPDSANGDWLKNRHAKIWLGGWKQATYATGSVKLSGSEGTIVPKATQLSGSNDGTTVLYQTTKEVTISGASVEVGIIALSAGSIGNIGANGTLSLTVALAGLNGTAQIVSLTGGTDEESEEELRARVLERIRQPPMGGSADDYVAWTKSVPGVTRAWCSGNEMGVGSLTVRFMMDQLRADNGGIPTQEDIATVKAYLDSVRPVASKDLFVVAPILHPINFSLSNIATSSAIATSAVRAYIEQNVAEMLKEKAAPARMVAGIKQAPQTIYASWVSEAISAVSDIAYFILDMEDITMPNNGAIATLGTITYD